MSDPFLGEITIFAGNFAPRNWAFCDGQLIAISQNSALFSLLGTIYGGDGRTTFALPDLRGRVPMHQGTGPGLTTRPIGRRDGAETVTLGANELPSHRHTLRASTDPAQPTADPVGDTVGDGGSVRIYGPDTAGPIVAMSPETSSDVGGSQSHDNMAPFLGIHFIIAIAGVFPSRN